MIGTLVTTTDARPRSRDLLERYLALASAGHAQRSAALAALIAALTEDIHGGRQAEAAELLRQAIAPGIDLSSLQAIGRVRSMLPRSGQPLRLAVLGGYTTDHVAQGIDVFLFASGIDVEVYSSVYGAFRQEILDPGSGLYRFAPEVAFLATSRRDLGRLPALGDDKERVSECIAAELREWGQLWQTVHERLGCQIIQNNFDSPPWRLLANREMAPSAPGGYLTRLNLALYEGAPPYVTVHDADSLSALAGKQAWGEERYFHAAKLPCAPPFLVDYAQSISSVIAALRGKSRKCLVLDLDNTLWGGVIGDDGLAGIRLGQGDAEGEAFQAFQEYAAGLRRRGILLAVCSKNTGSIAREVFERHPQMRLRLEDIACFVANWDDKATNLHTIAKTLNIGLDSLVFVDDNPAERSLVRRLAPAVAVPEMPSDPAGYIAAIEQHRYFQVTTFTAEDLQRAEYYRADAARRQVAESTADLGEFLRSLSMRARIGPISPDTLERSVQLINKSNQYNLTTRRCSSAEIVAKLDDPRWVTRTVSIADRFGDNGLISVVLAEVAGDELRIDTWLMSCRVLQRNVEHHLLNHLVALARSRGLGRIRGEYVPTAKNAIVADHFERLGFACTGRETDGRTSWELVTDSWSSLPSYIETVEETA
jgi:FkbH-like protein